LNDLSRLEGNEPIPKKSVFNRPVGSISMPISLYEKLAYRIECLLFSSRKGDPNYCISMTFDATHFDGLISEGPAKCVYIINTK